ncbi:hypothetical protein ABT160_05720 [Streptomyces sp. NPDC001941]|uniref:hypothetical protein n=1 Tax=Streptomyces sp. NPDC001941 TaxID=3154659 RepID=UPI0033300CA3
MFNSPRLSLVLRFLAFLVLASLATWGLSSFLGMLIGDLLGGLFVVWVESGSQAGSAHSAVLP